MDQKPANIRTKVQPTPTGGSDSAQAAAATYDAASNHFDDAALSFWDRFGSRTVERVAIASGETVLDVCCGSGASALPAARAAGPKGGVLAVDVSTKLLALGRGKASASGVTNIEFRSGDLANLGLDDAAYDAVICVFGIFFVPDIEKAIAGLWRLVRPGGRLAITTWGPRIFEPVNSVFWAAVREERPDLVKDEQPWDRITQPDALRAVLARAGVSQAKVTLESGHHPLSSPEDWWTIVLGSGYRATVDQLEVAARERVRDQCERWLREHAISSIEASVIYSVAAKG